MNFKCKMCGGSIDFIKGVKVFECPYCGSIQTMPSCGEEDLLSLYVKANNYRLAGEFDSAIKTYEEIIRIKDEEAEAHFGLFLSRYGITYVKDPESGKELPTINRLTTKNLLEDEDYLKAINLTDVVTKTIYQEEAFKINDIFQKALALSQKEEPYDIFISYKETVDDKRTDDSVIAQEIYQALTSWGYKVFFSRISLKTKVGSEYEPLIYSALRSSKVMLVIGTTLENFNAPWVKNEWSRFLNFLKDHNDKYLIPCYKFINPRDLPASFHSLQAINLGEVGYLQDLKTGLNKLLKPEIKNDNKGPNLETILKRVEMLIKDEDYYKADDLLEEVLNNDPFNAKAYYHKLFVDYRVNNFDDLVNHSFNLNENKNYLKLKEFGKTKELKSLITKLNAAHDDFVSLMDAKRNYTNGLTLIKEAKYEEALKAFELAKAYEDSKEKIAFLKKEIRLIRERELKKITDALDLSLNLETFNEKSYLTNIKNLKALKYFPSKAELIKKYEALYLKNKEALTTYRKEIKIRKLFKELSECLSVAGFDEALYQDIRTKLVHLGVLESDLKSYDEKFNKIKEMVKKAKVKKTVKILSLVSGIVIVLISALLIFYFAIYLPNYEDWRIREIYKLEEIEDGYQINGFNKSTEDLPDHRYLKVPSHYKDKPITKIMNLSRASFGTVIIPETVNEIGEYAFDNLSAGKLIFADVPLTLSKGAFKYSKIKEIILPDSLEIIPDYAFAYSDIQKIKLPSKLLEIGDYAFMYCDKLKEIEFNSKLKRIGDYAFQQADIRTFSLPNGIKEVGEGAFHTKEYTTIYLPHSLEKVGKYLVNNGLFLVEDKVLNSHWDPNFNGFSLDSRKFKTKYGVNKAVLSGPYWYYIADDGGALLKINEEMDTIDLRDINVSEIDDHLPYPESFSRYTNLYLPDSLSLIGERAFYMRYLKHVTFGKNVMMIKQEAFAANNLTCVILPENLLYVKDRAFAWNNDLVKMVLSVKTELSDTALLRDYKHQVLNAYLYEDSISPDAKAHLKKVGFAEIYPRSMWHFDSNNEPVLNS